MKWFQVGVFAWPMGVRWFGKVGVRVESFWPEVEAWYAWQHERTGGVRPYRGVRRHRRRVNWRGPARAGSPVWGWRARVLAWAALHQRLKGVPQRTRDGQNVLGIRLQRELGRVAKGNSPWSVGLEGRVDEAIALVRTRWALRNASLPPTPGRPRKLWIRIGPSGPVIER